MKGPTMKNPLTDLVPAQYRKYIYLAASVASTVYGIWQATNHNWSAFAAGVVGALVTALAHGNVKVPSQVASFVKAAEPVVDAAAKAAPEVAAVADVVAAQAPVKKAAAPKAAAPKVPPAK